MTRPVYRLSPRLLELESRLVPAGNVTAALANYGYGPVLSIRGDGLANSVVLTSGGDGVVEVRGINTTVNGGSKVATFTGVRSLWADMSGGDDTLRSSGLRFRGTDPDSYVDISIMAGAGNDTVQLTGTTAVDTALALWVGGDNPDEPNGDDRIDVTGTTVQGRSLYIGVYSDGWTGATNGNDTVTIANTNYSYASAEPGDYGGFFIQAITGEEGPAGGADRLTIDNLSAVASADILQATFDILNGYGDDQTRLSNIDIHFDARSYYTLDLWSTEWYDLTGSFGGVDTVELRNVNVKATLAEGDGHGYAYVTLTSELAEVSNVNIQTDGWILLGVGTERADVRNVSLASDNDTAVLGVEARGIWGDPTAFDSTDFRLTNVSVTGDTDVGSSAIYFLESDSPNRVELVNCTSDVLYCDSYFGPNAGADSMAVTNCHFTEVFIALGDGNDTVTLQNNTFGEVVVQLGTGDDSATVKNNTATSSIAIDGGGGTDTLIAWLNLAPLVDFDNFEL